MELSFSPTPLLLFFSRPLLSLSWSTHPFLLRESRSKKVVAAVIVLKGPYLSFCLTSRFLVLLRGSTRLQSFWSLLNIHRYGKGPLHFCEWLFSVASLRSRDTFGASGSRSGQKVMKRLVVPPHIPVKPEPNSNPQHHVLECDCPNRRLVQDFWPLTILIQLPLSSCNILFVPTT